MNGMPIVIVQEQNNIQKQIKNIKSKQYRNTKKNADLDNQCGKEYLERAKKTKDGKTQEEKDGETKLAAKNLIDSVEKYAKANAIIHGEADYSYPRSNKNSKKCNKEKVKQTHSFDIMRQAPSNSKIQNKNYIHRIQH